VRWLVVEAVLDAGEMIVAKPLAHSGDPLGPAFPHRPPLGDISD
jgi:hypothetical protein